MRWLMVLGLVAACGGGTQARVATPVHEGSSYHGYATFYAESQMTASGERFDKHAMTAAHRTLRMGTMVKVTNERNGRSVVVRINDRGPFGSKKRIIDLSEAAARKLDMIEAGVVPVTLEVLR
ncbi:MAG: septal ring lytic transglycosylase RlpA family protein [Kofleriaceae bacterium]